MNTFKTATWLLPLALFGAGCFAQQPKTPEPAQTTSTQAATSTPAAKTATTTTTTKPKTLLKPTVRPPTSQTVTILITDSGFSPSYTGIMEGDTVVWVNKGTQNHTSASNGAILWDSGNIAPGQSYKHTFPASGSYSYRDSIGHFNATIIVNAKPK